MKKNWTPELEKDEFNDLKKLACNGVRGIDAFKKQRSLIMKLSHHCLDNNMDMTFGECQQFVWDSFDSIDCDEDSKEELNEKRTIG